MKKALAALVLTTVGTSVVAMDPMPQEAGFGGFLGLGAAGGPVESNFLAEVLSIDLSNDDIYDYDSPSETTIIMPSFEYNFGYTFSNRKTRIYIGSAVEDSINFSTNSVLAFRHDFDSLGNMEIAGLGTGLAQVKVWENPYELGQDRDSTEFSTSGGRFTWDKIFGTNLEFIANARSIDIDKERSGQDLGLDPEQIKLLDREGDVTRIELGYAASLGDNVVMRPSVAYIDRDLDGDAMAQDGYELGLLFVYDAVDYKWLNHIAYQSLDGDQDNPIFEKTNDADVYVLASEVRVPQPFGWDKWTVSAGAQWADNDANIDFNQSTVSMFFARLGRSF